MIRKIITTLLSLFFSIGLTLLIKPHFETYIKPKLLLNLLLIIFTIIGYAVLYQIISKKIVNKKL